MEHWMQKILEGEITSLLKTNNFKKKGNTWSRERNNFIDIINFQKSTYSSHDETIFTINVGIFHAKTWQLCWDKEIPKYIKEIDCFPRYRIGSIVDNSLTKTDDLWWHCSDSNLIQTKKDLLDKINIYCFNFFEKFSSLEDIVSIYNSENIRLFPLDKIYLSIMKYQINDFIGFEKLLNEVSELKGWNEHVERIKQNSPRCP